MPDPLVTRRRQPRMPIEVRREQVLDAALRLIGRHGYGATTMEAIAREADLAKPVVYNAYPNRSALLRALLERQEQRALASLARAVPTEQADDDPARLLRSWLRSLAGAIAADPVPWSLMLIPGGETPAEVRDHVQAGRDVALGQVRSMLDRLLDDRPALGGFDRELAARTLLASAEHCARLMISDPRAFPPERLADFGDSLLSALLAQR